MQSTNANAVVGYLRSLFGRRGATGIQMAARATRLAMPQDRVDAICVAYVAALVAAS